MIDENQVHAMFEPIWADAVDEKSFPQIRPLLAHYTAMSTLEAIMKNDELWLANPLFMNDMQELEFGLREAQKAFHLHSAIETACGGQGERYDILRNDFEKKMDELINDHALDTYVMCFCEHLPENNDGLLSMWRGYGGNGSGAAVVFDTARIVEVKNSPLVLSRVIYGTTEQRMEWINKKLDQFALLLQQNSIPSSMLYLPIDRLLERLKLFALFSKHNGFLEEQEWRLVYIKDRDREGKLEKMFHYHVRDEKIEPKLKLKIGSIPGVINEPSRLSDLVDRIILGPATSSSITLATVKRMMHLLRKEDLVSKIRTSSTPYRPKI